ncbi:MAG: ABC transporter substrate-binding protein [Gemmatimonadaceae bacterium]
MLAPLAAAAPGRSVRYALLAAITLCACRAPGPVAVERAERAARAKGDVVIAAVWPWAQQRAVHFGDGLRMALDEVNATGGVDGRHVRVVRFDDQASVDKGRLVAEQIGADPNVVAVIGHLQSYVSVPAAAIYDLTGLVMISPAATDPQLTSQGYRRVFRTTFTDRSVGRRMADFAMHQGYHRIAICYIRDTYGRDLANAFEERATEIRLTVVARQSYDASGEVSDHTFEPVFRDWKGTAIDAIFLAGEVPSAAQFIAQARHAGIVAPIIGGDALNSGVLMQLAGAAAEGTVVPSVFHFDEPGAEARHFTAAFSARFGTPPDAGAALGYDALRILVDAMRRAHSTVPDSVARTLHEMRDWRGATGTLSFDSAGNLVHQQVVTMVVRNGQFDLLGERVVAAVPAPETAKGAHPVAAAGAKGVGIAGGSRQ